MCFEYPRVIFHWRNGSKFSNLLTVRADGADPPLTVSLTVKYMFFTSRLSTLQNCHSLSIASHWAKNIFWKAQGVAVRPRRLFFLSYSYKTACTSPPKNCLRHQPIPQLESMCNQTWFSIWLPIKSQWSHLTFPFLKRLPLELQCLYF